tara:strand:- start:5912 stop:6109 length:198 start_codon:yes stop_codon:yes gene_type:complete
MEALMLFWVHFERRIPKAKTTRDLKREDEFMQRHAGCSAEWTFLLFEALFDLSHQVCKFLKKSRC